ncbi:MAG: helix-turn-helix transcriptional regulator [Rhizobiales bacterium]|nr:helix-turn-helix transcriptional regulator [Hyphomicrobiales bacterium]
MSLDLSSFGRTISSARKAIGLSQKELAAKIKKEDGEPITPQYLNDIEHDRRSPQSDHLVSEFAKVLKIDTYSLYAAAGMLPEQDRKLLKKASPAEAKDAFVAFRRKLTG